MSAQSYTATLVTVADALAAIVAGQTAQTALLTQLVANMTAAPAPVAAAAPVAKASTPVTPKAAPVKAAPVKAAPVAKPMFTSYVHDGDLYVGVLVANGATKDDVLPYDVRLQMHRRMEADHKAQYVHVDVNAAGVSRVNPFRNPPMARVRNGYAVMRVGRPDGDDSQAHMIASAYHVLVPSPVALG